MRKQLGILLAGIFVVVPFALTVYVIYFVGAWVNSLGTSALQAVGINLHDTLKPWVGMLAVLAIVYLIGLMTHFWVFRSTLNLFERIFSRVPGIKTIYNSVRDLMELFGPESKRMGRVVLYEKLGTDLAMLGILTNDNPPGSKGKVAVYFPLSYMIGGPVMYISPEHLREIDMPVEQALKLCATAQVGATAKPSDEPSAAKAPQPE